MKKMLTLLIVTGLALTFAIPAMAADQQRKRDRKKDGSCQSISAVDQQAAPMCDRDRTRDRKRDGSCQAVVTMGKGKQSGPRDGTGPRRDGSCQSASQMGKKTGPQDGTGPRRDGSCQ
ncbi:MAG: hypothetical protein IT445_01405 [Phycisphaeraceae bacterium]|nr:hypothetical protein [Phycisphaeraceae bacterium]